MRLTKQQERQATTELLGILTEIRPRRQWVDTHVLSEQLNNGRTPQLTHQQVIRLLRKSRLVEESSPYTENILVWELKSAAFKLHPLGSEDTK
jgi:hypothetical protein